MGSWLELDGILIVVGSCWDLGWMCVGPWLGLDGILVDLGWDPQWLLDLGWILVLLGIAVWIVGVGGYVYNRYVLNSHAFHLKC